MARARKLRLATTAVGVALTLVVLAGLAIPATAAADSVSCSPNAVVLGQSTICTATSSVMESGFQVNFTTNGPGTFSATMCLTDNAGQCSVTYKPSALGSAPHTITADFGSEGVQPTAIVDVATMTCMPSTIVVGQSTTCVATATIPAGEPGRFTTDGQGSFSPNSTCNTTGPQPGPSNCSVSYAPSQAGSGKHTITATFLRFNVSPTATVNVRNPSSTLTVCSPGALAVGQTATCSATVSDATGTGGSTPSGVVSFSSSGQSGFDAATCTLSGAGVTASCTVSYTPQKGGAGTQAVTAAYGGDALHAGSSGSANVTVTHPEGHSTATSVSCSPAIVVPGKSAACVATVTDTGGGATMTPIGSVTFSTSGGGTLNPSGPCTLTGSGKTASCRVSYRPGTGADTQTITAVYGGDLVHEGGSGFTNVALPPQTGVTAVVSVVRGQVLISLPGGGRAVAAAAGPPPAASFFPIKGVTQSVPVGSTLDTRKGVVRLVTAADDDNPSNPHHQTQSGTFAAAEFTIKQMTTAQRLAAAHREHKRRLTGIPATNLLLTNPFSDLAHAHCTRTRHPGHGVIRELSAVAKGLYRTVGAASTTVVHDATWIVKDRCDGTFTELGRGSAVVQFKVRGRQHSQVVKPGQAFFVRRPFLAPLRKGR